MNISDLVPWRGKALARRDTDDLSAIRRDMDRLFEDFFRGFEKSDEMVAEGDTFMPLVNVTESEDAIEVSVELPGMEEDDIDITLTRDYLTITGEKQTEVEDKGKTYVRRERSRGYFRRQIPLPANVVDRDRVEASFSKGVLTVQLPKREESQPSTKRIPVKAE
jgi:HSP20 family protein